MSSTDLGRSLSPPDDQAPAIERRASGLSSASSNLQAVLAEFGLSSDPKELRAELSVRLRPAFRRPSSASHQSLDTVSLDGDVRQSSRCSGDLASSPRLPSAKRQSKRRQNTWGMSRMAVRLQIFEFLKVPNNRFRVLTLWRNGAESLQQVKQHGSWLGDKEDVYRRLYKAFETMFSNLLDENDSPIRGVLFDLLSREAKRLSARGEYDRKPPQMESTKKAVQQFVDAVLDVRSSSKQTADSKTAYSTFRLRAKFAQIVPFGYL
jgi:hypothetical protein